MEVSAARPWEEVAPVAVVVAAVVDMAEPTTMLETVSSANTLRGIRY